MKNLVVVVVLIAVAAAVYFVVWPALQGKYAAASTGDRVEAWLASQKQGDEQTALCMWAVGKPMMSIEEMRGWTDDYDAFRRRAGIMERLESYSIESVTPPIVKVLLNGERFTLRVDSSGPISFAE